MAGLFPLFGVLAFAAGLLSSWWYVRTKRPIVALLAGALFLLAFVVLWRSFIPAGDRYPWMK